MRQYGGGHVAEGRAGGPEEVGVGQGGPRLAVVRVRLHRPLHSTRSRRQQTQNYRRQPGAGSNEELDGAALFG